MSSSWPVWLIGAVLLVGAGFAAVAVPRLRAERLHRRTAWSAARAAIDTAGVSRDACPVEVAEAEHLLTRAELIAARRGGRAAAETATGYAERADSLWRAATRG